MEVVINSDGKDKYLHRKSNKIYTLLCTCINCTNAQDGQIMVMYMNNEGMLFVREQSEFIKKFIKIE